MGDIVFVDKPVKVAVQALQDCDPAKPAEKFRFVRIEDAFRQRSERLFYLAEWLDSDWPLDPDALIAIVGNRAASPRQKIRQALIKAGFDAKMIAALKLELKEKRWGNNPFHGVAPLLIYAGKSKFFCTLGDGIAWLSAEPERTIALSALTPGTVRENLVVISITNTGDRLEVV